MGKVISYSGSGQNTQTTVTATKSKKKTPSCVTYKKDTITPCIEFKTEAFEKCIEWEVDDKFIELTSDDKQEDGCPDVTDLPILEVSTINDITFDEDRDVVPQDISKPETAHFYPSDIGKALVSSKDVVVINIKNYDNNTTYSCLWTSEDFEFQDYCDRQSEYAVDNGDGTITLTLGDIHDGWSFSLWIKANDGTNCDSDFAYIDFLTKVRSESPIIDDSGSWTVVNKEYTFNIYDYKTYSSYTANVEYDEATISVDTVKIKNIDSEFTVYTDNTRFVYNGYFLITATDKYKYESHPTLLYFEVDSFLELFITNSPIAYEDDNEQQVKCPPTAKWTFYGNDEQYDYYCEYDNAPSILPQKITTNSVISTTGESGYSLCRVYKYNKGDTTTILSTYTLFNGYESCFVRYDNSTSDYDNDAWDYHFTLAHVSEYDVVVTGSGYKGHSTPTPEPICEGRNYNAGSLGLTIYCNYYHDINVTITASRYNTDVLQIHFSH